MFAYACVYPDLLMTDPPKNHNLTQHPNLNTPPKTGQAANAGLLAVRILGAARPDILNKMEIWLREQKEQVLTKAEKLEAGGWRAYLGPK